MALTLPPQTKSEAIPPKDIGGDAFLAEAYSSLQILGFCLNNFSPMDVILKFLEAQ